MAPTVSPGPPTPPPTPTWEGRFEPGTRLGHVYLSMEYIDGEDLASVLRRMGRLTSDKAIEIARQLCHGLAAAHQAGMLHRDVKPANVMIDGRCRARGWCASRCTTRLAGWWASWLAVCESRASIGKAGIWGTTSGRAVGA